MKYESLQYLDQYKQETGKNYQFFFDAFDVVQLLQGVHRFYPSEINMKESHQKFFSDRFCDESTIVHALAFGRFIGTGIKLLPTHQAELARVIKTANNDGHYIFFRKADNTLKQFLEKDLKFHDKLKEMTSNPRIQFDENVLRSWIEEKNQDIFKAIFLSYKANYKERLEELFANGIIKTESYSLDDIEIHDDYLFTALSAIFKENRPKKESGGNNFSDVAALMYLSRLVGEYNADNSKPLPVYFDSHNYQSIIPNQILNSYFRIHTKMIVTQETSAGYALRQHDFFKLYALMNYNSLVPIDEDLKYRNFVDFGKSAETLKKSFMDAGLVHGVPDLTRWYQKENDELRNKIMRYIEIDFYKVIINEVKSKRLDIINHILVWLNKEELNPETAEAITQQNQIFLTHIDNEINELLRETVSMYNLIQNRIKHVITVADKLKENNQELDLFTHYSMFRFLIPKVYKASIQHFFSQDGLLSNNNELSNFSKVTLWNFYYRTVYYKHNKGVSRKKLLDVNELYILYGSFWILNLHDKLIDFNSKEEYLRPLDHSLLMLIGACIDRAIAEAITEENDEERTVDDGQQKENLKKYRALYNTIIQVLEERVNKESGQTLSLEKTSEIKIVLAYLYFHLWIQEGNVLIVMRSGDTFDGIAYGQGTSNFKAVAYAREAFSFFKINDLKSSPYYLYAFNIYIYYVTDSAPDEEFRKLGSLRSEFINLGRSKNWHFRYNDTIARSFHRLSKLVTNNESKLEYIKRAIDVLQSNLKELQPLDGRDINEVRAYFDALTSVKGDLEIAYSF